MGVDSLFSRRYETERMTHLMQDMIKPPLIPRQTGRRNSVEMPSRFQQSAKTMMDSPELRKPKIEYRRQSMDTDIHNSL